MKNVIIISGNPILPIIENAKEFDHGSVGHVTDERWTVEIDAGYVYFDIADDIAEDYGNEVERRGGRTHFASLIYHNPAELRIALSPFKCEDVLIDDDMGSILPIKEFLNNIDVWLADSR